MAAFNINFKRTSVFDDYDILWHEKLGEGGFGKVYKAICKKTDKLLAVKVMDNTLLARQEIKMHQLAGDHPNVLKLHDVYCHFASTPDDAAYGKCARIRIFVILDFMAGGCLYKRIVRAGKLSEDQVKEFLKSFLLAVKHLHAQGITHRDLKPENILFSSTDNNDFTNLVIADFGLAFSGLSSDAYGSGFYISRDAIATMTQPQAYGTCCDMWSVGIIALVALTGRPPFRQTPGVYDVTKDKLMKSQIMDECFIADVLENANISTEAKDFIGQLLKANSSERLTVEGALQSTFLNDNTVLPSPVITDSISSFPTGFNSISVV